MRFRLLGPLRVWNGQKWSSIRAAQQRAVLAILLIESGRPVLTERLVDEMWGDKPPPTAVATIQGYVMWLRRLLGTERHRLATVGHGYQLTVEEGDLDVAVFESLAASGIRRLADGELNESSDDLSEALALWRGEALTDIPAGAMVAAEARRLTEARMSTLEEFFDCQLRLGRHNAIFDELGRVTREHSLRERLWAQLILALHRCGRRAEALEAYQEVRAILVNELGLEPGEQLRRLQAGILAEDPALAPPSPAIRVNKTSTTQIPAQLPPDVAGFAGREGTLAELDEALTGYPVMALSVIAGTAGVGKTALAVHWAHRVKDHFPDGQLFVDLRGYAADLPLRPIEVLARFLRALGAPAGEIPSNMDEATALYRSLLAGRRVLIVLDNASHPDQVRPLLPGSPHCLVLVTSRDQLAGLVARDGASRVTLGVLEEGETRELLNTLIGEARTFREPAEVSRLGALCGHLPLALRIAGANVGTQPGTIALYVEKLAGIGPLNELQVPGDPHAAIRPAFDHSYTALPAEMQQLFRLLGLVPGPQITAVAAGELAGMTAHAAVQALQRLTSVNLIEEREPGRYSLHDLLRQYAHEKAIDSLAEHDRQTALTRLHSYYLSWVTKAADLMYPHVSRLPLPREFSPAPHSDDFLDAEQASAWLDAERSNLVAAAATAAGQGLAAFAWLLADALRGYLYLRMYREDWLTVAEAGLAAAHLQGDLRAQAAAHSALATLYWSQGNNQQAIEHYAEALEFGRNAGWAEGEAAALGNLGNLHWATGDFSEAAANYRSALEAVGAGESPASQPTALGNLGLIYFGQGKLDDAVEVLNQALSIQRKHNSQAAEARVLGQLGEVYHAQGNLEDALEILRLALDLARTIGGRSVEGDILRALAMVHSDAGRQTDALDLAGLAVRLARETGDRRLEIGALTTRANVHDRLGQVMAAIDGHQQALRLSREIGNRYLETEALIGLATAKRLSSKAAAQSYAEEALAIATRGGYRLLESRASQLIADLRDVVTGAGRLSPHGCAK